MIPVNLIPSARRRTNSGRQRVRRWALAGIAYAAVLAGAYATFALQGSNGPKDLDARMLTVASEVQIAEEQSGRLGGEIAAARHQLAAARSITDHPDWSVLLGLVSGARLGEVVLDSCELSPGATSEAAPPKARPEVAATPAAKAAPVAVRTYTLKLSGIGRRQGDIPRFLLRLEQLGLFDRVTLVESRSRALADREVFAFKIECALRDPGGPSS